MRAPPRSTRTDPLAPDLARFRSPGIRRTRWGFEAWLDHKPAVWARLVEEAEQRRADGLAKLDARFYGSDLEPRAITASRANAEPAGLAGKLVLRTGDAIAARPPTATSALAVNTAARRGRERGVRR